MAETNYIHANARFAFRSDSLENWENANPILLAGEFGVATNGSEVQKVKIGNGVTPWNSLPWWRGPKGDKGDNYILSDTDKHEIAAFIDLPKADQTYNSMSENAQSGKAVSEGIVKALADVDNTITNSETATLNAAKAYTDSRIDQNFDINSNNAVSGSALMMFYWDFLVLKANVGDIETALDNIIAIQNNLIGGDEK